MFRSLAKIICGFVLLSSVAYPCGDKLLVILRNPRYATKERPAAILAYAPAGSLTAAFASDKDLRAALQKAGHHFQSVETPASLRRALDGGHYDLVIADVADANVVEAASPGSFLVPIVAAQPDAGIRAAEKSYRALIKMPEKNGRLLDTIQKALEEKNKQERAIASK